MPLPRPPASPAPEQPAGALTGDRGRKARLNAGALIGAICLGSGLLLLGGRRLLRQQVPALTPNTSRSVLEHSRRWSVDPQRRREAALLLSAEADADPNRRRRWLRGQGWGPGAVAATSLKQAALAAKASGRPQEAENLWQQLLGRFPDQAASADALYALGRQRPQLRQTLLARFPAHPAALAAALERREALHLARWGPRWPGAEPLLRQACRGDAPDRSAAERQQLAAALVQLGDGMAALGCLDSAAPASPGLQLNLARALMRQGPGEQQRGRTLLLGLLTRRPEPPEVDKALALLADQTGAETLSSLRQLPPGLRHRAPVQARLALEGDVPWAAVLRRWPREPSSWDLQWELARQALLRRHWPQAQAVLGSLDSRQLPPPLAARQLFWQGYSAWQQGARPRAEGLWRELLRISPGGYYAWRAQSRLGAAGRDDPRRPPADRNQRPASPPGGDGAELPWHPLNSGDADLDTLWRLGMPLEAWEIWRHRQGGSAPASATALLIEGRLRTAIGDDWTGLEQLEQAGLRLPQTSCRAQWQRELQQHPRRFRSAMVQAAAAHGLDQALLLAVARQESRFTPAVSSAAGAVGLLQLMPATAAELAEAPLSAEELQEPARNALLGARYLRQLLDRWQGEPFLAVASYNAGPGAVASWLGAGRVDVRQEPELWTEAIPYPETRLYTKKVLGNYWTYRQAERPAC